MKCLLLLSIAILFAWASYAQSASYRITAEIYDAENNSIPGASVLLTRYSDTSILKTAISDSKGRFQLILPDSGNYKLSVMMLGYEHYESESVLIDAQHSNVLLRVKLRRAGATELKSISVTAKKPLIEQQTDKVVMNVDALISSAGSNALQVLSRAPGVLVTANGAVSLNGRDGVLVLINGRTTYLAGDDLTNYLRSLPGSTIDKIEIMSNPPAKYEASGNAGVINIRIKKNTNKGFNGNMNVSYTQAVYWKTNDAFNFNYRNNKVNFFGNVGYSGSRDYVKTNILRNYYHPDAIVNMSILNKNVSDGINLRAGMDYQASEKTTVGFVVNALTRPNSEKKYTTSDLFSNKPDSTVQGYLDGQYKWKNAGINLNLQHKFDSAGRELTADADYISYRTDGTQFFDNIVLLPVNIFKSNDQLLGKLPGNIEVYSLKVDYMHPLASKWRIDFGAKTSYVKSDNAAEYYVILNGTQQPDFDKTNRFLYNENINAAYLNLHKEFKRWGIQMGLRAENTNANGHQLGNISHNDSSFRRKYTDLFPTFYLSYKLDSAGINNLTFSYGRRIERPAYNNLNPFLFFRDKFSFRAGNPFLKPQYANNLELAYKYKSYFSATLLYNAVDGEIRETVEQIGNIFISRSANVGKNYSAGILLNGSYDLTSWWRATLYVQDLYKSYKAVISNDAYLDTSMNTWGSSLYNEFKFKHGWSAELYAMYIGDNLLGQFTRKPLWQIDAGLQKMVLKNKGSLRLSANDIFHKLKIQGEIMSIKNAGVYYSNVFDTRSVALAFTYKFGKESKRGRRTGGAEAEQNRVGN